MLIICCIASYPDMAFMGIVCGPIFTIDGLSLLVLKYSYLQELQDSQVFMSVLEVVERGSFPSGTPRKVIFLINQVSA